jgi:hypothetical protein
MSIEQLEALHPAAATLSMMPLHPATDLTEPLHQVAATMLYGRLLLRTTDAVYALLYCMSGE